MASTCWMKLLGQGLGTVDDMRPEHGPRVPHVSGNCSVRPTEIQHLDVYGDAGLVE